MAVHAGVEVCWGCGAEVARGMAGTACPNCGPLTVTKGFEWRFAPHSGEAVGRQIDYCTTCGLDTCLGCEEMGA